MLIINLRKTEDCHKEGGRGRLQVLNVLIHLPSSVAAVEALSERDGCNLIKKKKERTVVSGLYKLM